MKKGIVKTITLKEILCYLYQDSLLPEIFQIFGEEDAERLIKIFGGTTVRFPDYKRVVLLKRSLDIYETLAHVNTRSTVKALASKYSINEDYVLKTFQSMRREYGKILDFIERPTKEIQISTKRNSRNEKEQN